MRDADYDGALIGKQIVDAIGDSDASGMALGHVPDTALPGMPGNVALAGHRVPIIRGFRLEL